MFQANWQVLTEDPRWLWLGLALVLLGCGVVFWRHVVHQGMRRYALAELRQIRQRYQQNQDAVRYLQSVNMLLRRIAVKNFSRAQVEGLTGDEWLNFLDWSRSARQRKKPGFVEGCGRVLDHRIYQAEPDSFDEEQVYQLIRRWIRQQT